MRKDEVFDYFTRRDGTQLRGPGQLMARCPAHEDADPSLSVSWDGVTLRMHCFAGCAYGDVAEAIGLERGRGRPVEHTHYVYTDEVGRPLFRVVRTPEKKFYQQKFVERISIRSDSASGDNSASEPGSTSIERNEFRSTTRGEYVLGARGVRAVPFRLPNVIAAPREAWVLVVEGEKDVLAGEALGFAATCNPGGAGKWRREFAPLFRGRRVAVIPDNDEPGQKHAERVADLLVRTAREVRIVALPGLAEKGDLSDWFAAGGTSEALAGLIEEADAYQMTSTADLVRLDTVQMGDVRWLWPELIPRDKVTVIAGDPGAGKSFVTLDLAARLSAGKLLPGQTEACEPTGTLLLACEDDITDTIAPRLAKMGADLSRIVVLRGMRDYEESERTRLVCLERDLERVADAINTVRGCGFVVIDPISAYLQGTDSNSNVEIRGLLTLLGEIAEQKGVAVLVVSHNRKARAGKALHRVMGSLAFTATARSVLSVVPDSSVEGRRLLIPVKSNVAVEPCGYAYYVRDGSVTWEPDPVLDWGDEDSFKATLEDRIQETAALLRERIEREVSVPAVEVQQWLRSQGIPHHVVWAAKAAAGVKSVRKAERFYWEMAEEE